MEIWLEQFCFLPKYGKLRRNYSVDTVTAQIAPKIRHFCVGKWLFTERTFSTLN